MGHVDNRSPELAYATKNNIVFPGSAAQASAAESLAATRAADDALLGQDTTSVAAGAVTLTKHIKR